jgi:hypothetical protein
MENVSEQILLEAKKKLNSFLEGQDKNLFNQEVKNVCHTENRLFPYPILIDTETTDIFRSMCIYSQSIIKSENDIKSHRPIVGKIIVFAKKMAWNLVKPLINNSLLGIQECFSNLVVSQAKLTASILKKTSET